MPPRHENEVRHQTTQTRQRHLEFRAVALSWLICFVLSWHGGHAQSTTRQAVVETSLGTFIIDLTPDAAPNHVAYFTKLAQDGAYEGTTFHRAVKYGMVQGGDPISKDPSKRSLYGTGGQNAIKAEARAEKMTRGSVAAVLVPGRPDSAVE